MLLELALSTLGSTPPAPPVDPGSEATGLTQPMATIFSGLIVALGIIVGFITATKSRRSAESMAAITDKREREKAIRDHEREVMSARQDRFTTIADQLASNNEPVRLAGIYSLAALADEWHEADRKDQRNVSIKLICAYLRASLVDNSDKEVRTAAISVIRDHTIKSSAWLWPSSIIDLNGADLGGANFMGSNLAKARFFRATLAYVNFREADLTEATLAWANLANAKMPSATLENANLTKAYCEDVDFSGAKLQNVNATSASMTRVKFTGANLRNANFSSAELHKADMRTDIPLAEVRHPVPLSESKRIKVDLHGVNFANSDMTGAKLSNADISQCDMSKANLTDVQAFDLNCFGMNINQVIFQDAKLRGSNFSNATLRGCNFRKAGLVNADFTGASMKQIASRWISDSELQLTDMSSADLAGANFSQADLSGVNFGTPEVDEAIFVSTNVWDPEKYNVVSWDEKTTWPAGFNIKEVISRQRESLGLSSS
ncbi:pentapeptide repeat-containing protein [Kocuria sp. CPCC 205231]|uniref:pentapeptide repeat-containing protein n=1 Tax=Kocuria sp. CPCC 205231 TaxID=3073551 RepID=UPI0034D4BEDA